MVVPSVSFVHGVAQRQRKRYQKNTAAGLAAIAAISVVVGPLLQRGTGLPVAFVSVSLAAARSDSRDVASEVYPSETSSRRTALGGLALMPLLGGASGAIAAGSARSGGGINLNAKTDSPRPGGLPQELDLKAEQQEEVTWDAIDIGESSIVDPNDPKYKNLRVVADLEKANERNKKYQSMSDEEKRDRICEVLGRGCSSATKDGIGSGDSRGTFRE